MTYLLFFAAASGVSLLAFVFIVVAYTLINNKLAKIKAGEAPDCCMCGGELDSKGWCGDRDHYTVTVAEHYLSQNIIKYGQIKK